jgi:hypothetical protein
MIKVGTVVLTEPAEGSVPTIVYEYGCPRKVNELVKFGMVVLALLAASAARVDAPLV